MESGVLKEWELLTVIGLAIVFGYVLVTMILESHR